MLCRWGHSRTMILLRSQLTFYTHVPITLPLRSKGDIFYSIIRGRDLNFASFVARPRKNAAYGGAAEKNSGGYAALKAWRKTSWVIFC